MKARVIILAILIAIFIGLSVLSYQETSKHREYYKEQVLSFVVEDLDLLDYNIDPERMTECVVNTTDIKMRGTRFDIVRAGQYDLYRDWIKVKMGEPLFTEIQDIKNFGAKIAGSEAHTNFGVSYQYCVEKVAPFNQQKVLEDDDWGRKVAINVRLWWNNLWGS